MQRAVAGGARIATGGKRPEAFAKGFFYEPTVIANASADSLPSSTQP